MIQELHQLVSERGRIYKVTDSESLNYILSITHTKTLDEASQIFTAITGGEIADCRDERDSEYTNINAQRDPDFWDEENINELFD